MTFAVLLPAALAVVQLSHDAIEYLDVARHLARGEGYLLSIKGYHFWATEVVHNGLDERAPLYPLLLALLLRFGLNLATIQVVNALLAGGCVALVCAIGRSLFGRRTGVLAAILALASPLMVIRLVPPMSESLAILLILLSCWLVARRHGQLATLDSIGAGAAAGLAYLARPTSAAVALAVFVGICVMSWRRQQRDPLSEAELSDGLVEGKLARGCRWAARAPLSFLIGLALFVVPICLYSLVVRGSLSYSGQVFLYSVATDDYVAESTTRQPLPSPIAFIAAHRDLVLSGIASHFVGYARVIFLDPDWLLPLVASWPLALLALIRGRYPITAWPFLLAALANFAISVFTWSTNQTRYLLPTMLLLLPFGVDGLTRLGLTRIYLPRLPRLTLLHLLVAVTAVYWSETLLLAYRGEFTYGYRTTDRPLRGRTDLGLTWTGPAQWSRDDNLAYVLDWINAVTDHDQILASPEPWPLTFFTERPSTQLPKDLTPEGLREFVAHYRVSYVLLISEGASSVYRRDYQPYLRVLASSGMPVTRVGSYRVFDARTWWDPSVVPGA